MMSSETHHAWQSILEEEENQWRRGHLQFDSTDHNADNFPTVLEQCHNIANLHGYFSNLELRKCCLKLAAVNTTLCNIRRVSENDNNPNVLQTDNNSLLKKENGRLTDKDFWVYRNVLFCATFPVLSVPDPPSEVSPLLFESITNRTSSSSSLDRVVSSPLTSGANATTTGASVSLQRQSSTQDIFQSIRFKFQTSLSDIRSRSDSFTSGIESSESGPESFYLPRTTCDTDEIAVLPPEVLTDWLRRVFYLNQETSRAYERKIFEPYRKKTFAKILVEELCRQLSLLESDSHPFYNSRMFMSREAYGRWQQRERARIGHMMSKFWHYSLPPVKNSNHLDVAQYHEDYRCFLHKLVEFEAYVRKSNGSDEEGPQLSSPSRRLLKEFALRYGIRDLYEKIVYLDLLSENFGTSPPFIQQVIGDICNLKQSLPKKMAKSVFVKDEYEILLQTLNALQGQCKNILTRIKRIYDDSQILIGVGGVIHLLALTVEIRAQLDIDNNPTLLQLLEIYTKENLHCSYERHKIIAMCDLEIDPRSADVTPKLINRLILNIKDEVMDYQRSYAPAYQRYMDVVKFAGGVLYNLLMEDVTNFCVTTNRQRDYPGIDLAVLGVAYRLDQLDRDPQWLDLVLCTHQTWRREFYASVLHWVKMIEKHAQRFVLQSVGTDNYIHVKISDNLNNVNEENLFQGSRCTSTNSQMSLTPSQFSAFSAVGSYRSLQIPTSAFTVPDATSEEDETHSVCTSIDKDQTNEQTAVKNSGDYVSHKVNPVHSFNAKLPRVTMRRRTLSSNLSIGLKTLRCTSVPPVLEEPCESSDLYLSKSCNETFLTDEGYFTGIGLRDYTSFIQDKNETLQESSGLVQTSVDLVHSVEGRTDDLEDNMHLGMDASEMTESGEVDSINGELCLDHLAESTPISGENIRPKSDLNRERPTCSPFMTFHDDSVSTPANRRHLVESGLPEVESMPNLRSKITENLQSKSKLPDEGDISSRPLLVSSSLIEVVVLIKRMIHTIKLFCDTFYPLKMVRVNVHDMDEELANSLKQNVIMRWKLTESLQESIVKTVELYSRNLLCMDLCGETNCVARNTLGVQVIEEVKKYKQNKLIWGCRHKKKKIPCDFFSHRNPQYLADKFEPVSLEMCTRVNDLLELSSILNELFSSARQSLCLDLTIKAAAKFHLVLEDESEVLCTEAKDSIKTTWKGMVHLLVYRMNLFTKEAMIVLHQLEIPRYVGIETVYQPVISFLRNHAVILKEWLNETAFMSLVRNWWKSFVKISEDLVQNLIESENMTVIRAKKLLQLLAYLMRFLCGRHVKMDLDFAETKVSQCMKTLNLCTISTIQLIVIYHLVAEEINEPSPENNLQLLPSRAYLQSMYTDLHHTRKCFTGVEMVRWIIAHSEDGKSDKNSQDNEVNSAGIPEVRCDEKTDIKSSKFPRSKTSPALKISDRDRAEASTSSGYKGSKLNDGKSDCKEDQLSKAINLASTLLYRGVINAVNFTPLSSTLGSMQGDVYPDIIHYSTSSRHTPNLGLHGSWSGPSGEYGLIDSLKKITSAPQFTLGSSSTIDLSQLKAELQRKLEGKLYSGYSESSDESQDQTLLSDNISAECEHIECHSPSTPKSSTTGDEDPECEHIECHSPSTPKSSTTGDEDPECEHIECHSPSTPKSSTTGDEDPECEHIECHSPSTPKSSTTGDEDPECEHIECHSPSTPKSSTTGDEDPECEHIECHSPSTPKSSTTGDEDPECEHIECHSPSTPKSSTTGDEDPECEHIECHSPSTPKSSTTGDEDPECEHIECHSPSTPKSSTTGDEDPVNESTGIDNLNDSTSVKSHASLEDSRRSSTSSNSTVIDEAVVMTRNKTPLSNEHPSSSPIKTPNTSHRKDNLPDVVKSTRSFSHGTSFDYADMSIYSNTFQNTETNLYHFRDGADAITPLLNRMMSNLGQDFQAALKEELSQLRKDNYCFGFQYQNTDPEFVLKVLNARRHHDALARKFLVPAQQNSEYGLLQESGSIGCFGIF